MERLALNKLIKWNKNRKKPLVVYGARQTGKTYLIKDIFAERYYKNKYIYIDFKKDFNARSFVNGDKKEKRPPVVDAKQIVEYFSLRENKKIDEHTLLIFDEIQEALPIITSLKYFKQDLPMIPVIASGSMVRIKIKRTQKNINNEEEKFFFPVGAIHELYVYPMTFDEFLLNANELLYKKIKESFSKKEALDTELHNLAMKYLFKYFLIGGMPENVDAYLSGATLIEVRENIQAMFDDYLSDMELYQASDQSIMRSKAIFTTIYNQLNKESKNFFPSYIEKGSKTRDYRSPLDWLITASAIYKSAEVKDRVTPPLCAADEFNFRLYLMDLGFLAYQSEINMSTFIDPAVQNTLAGAFFENYIACEMKAKGINLFYWKGKNNSEFEFLLSKNGTIYPVDVKKSRGTLDSLKKFRDHNTYNGAYKFSMNNFGFDEKTKITTMPLYMAPFFFEEFVSEKNKIDI